MRNKPIEDMTDKELKRRFHVVCDLLRSIENEPNLLAEDYKTLNELENECDEIEDEMIHRGIRIQVRI